MAIKLGNIITDSKDWFGKEFKVTNNHNRCIPNIPTLHIGYLKFKDANPDVSILKHQYDNLNYWTFNKKEDRNGYVAGLSEFKLDVVKRFLNNVKYTFVDPYELSITEIKNIIRKCNTETLHTFFYDEKMTYISVGNEVLGLDLELLTFIGLDTDKLLTKINGLENNVLVNSNVIIEYKDYLELMDNQVKLIPYLYSIDEGKKKTISNVRT